MSDLISRESLKQRINLNYNSHQYIDTQSIKDIINTEPSVEDKTVEELKKIKAEMQKRCDEFRWDNDDIVSEALIKIVDEHISEMKGDK